MWRGFWVVLCILMKFFLNEASFIIDVREKLDFLNLFINLKQGFWQLCHIILSIHLFKSLQKDKIKNSKFFVNCWAFNRIPDEDYCENTINYQGNRFKQVCIELFKLKIVLKIRRLQKNSPPSPTTWCFDSPGLCSPIFHCRRLKFYGQQVNMDCPK